MRVACSFGGAFRGEFIPELFRTRHNRALEKGQVVIIEVLGKYGDFWFDLNRSATIGLSHSGVSGATRQNPRCLFDGD